MQRFISQRLEQHEGIELGPPQPLMASASSELWGDGAHPVSPPVSPSLPHPAHAQPAYTEPGLLDKGTPTRNLVLCLDGMSNQFSTTNTNVIKLFGVLRISSGFDQKAQLAYYDSGVGTYLPVGTSGVWSRNRQDLGKALDLATAW